MEIETLRLMRSMFDLTAVAAFFEASRFQSSKVATTLWLIRKRIDGGSDDHAPGRDSLICFNLGGGIKRVSCRAHGKMGEEGSDTSW